ncbi:MAG: phospho-sugar mutase [Gemmataceae bacterium]
MSDDLEALLQEAQAGFATVAVAPELRHQAWVRLRQWLTDPLFAAYRPQLVWLMQQRRWDGLVDRFYQILPFGTGGRRGQVGIGPNRMNIWTLTASVQGHCHYLKQRFPEARRLRVVVAYDVRRFEDVGRQYNPQLPNPVLHLSSRDLAHAAIEVYAANGIEAWTLAPECPRYLATPELSFLIRHLHAQGGLNISASHNPPDDNGGKFYDELGGQPVPPEDQIMADLVEQVDQIRRLPFADAVRQGLVQFLDEETHRAYIEVNSRQSLLGPARPLESLIVYTPLHGVGRFTVLELLERHQYRVVPVESQMEPNGLFPHTQSANPEDPRSMHEALQLAGQYRQVDLILASDPDADRLGAMAPSPSGWHYLTGNQIAALLTHFKLEQLQQRGRLSSSPVVIKTEVTTGLVSRIARHFGCQVVDDLLVGFKYIADVLRHLEERGAYQDIRARPEDFVIGCEESHGILITAEIRDKDAAGAALLLAELALWQKRQGSTVLDYLERIYRRFGYFAHVLRSLAMQGLHGRQHMERMMESLRATPPQDIGGHRVERWEDLRREDSRLGPCRGATDRLARNVLVYTLENQTRIVLRPSGTEPKAKVYVEVATAPCPPACSPQTWQETCRQADRDAEALAQAFVRLALSRTE